MWQEHVHLVEIIGENGGSSDFWGAFTGAFFAFVFGLLTYVVTKRRERFVQHKNAIVRINNILNRHLNDLSIINEFVINNEKILSMGRVPTNRLFHLKLPEDIELEIANKDLINKVFGYRLSTDQLNLNIDSVNHSLTRIEDLFINGQTILPENFNYIRDTLNKFAEHIPKLIEEVMQLVTLLRVHHIKLERKNTFISGVFNNKWDLNIKKETLERERKMFEQEIVENQLKDTL